MNGGHQDANMTGEEAIRASELSFRRLFEAAKDGILILDFATGRITDANPFLCELLGFSRGEMIGSTVGELSPFRDIVSNRAMLELLQKHGYVRYEDLPLETKDGRKIAVEFVSNVYEAGGRKVIQCNIRDITERKKSELQAEEALLASTARFRSYFQLGQIGMTISSPDKAFIEINDKTCQILGYERSELLKMSWAKITHPDDLAADVGNFNRVLHGETDGYSMNKRFIRKDGQVIDAAISVRCVRGADGSADYFVAMLEDITEQRRMEEALRESEAKYRALFDAANDAIFLLRDGVFVDSNARGLEMFGVTREQIIGQSPAFFAPPTQPDGSDSQQAVVENTQRVLAGELQLFEFVHQRPDGTLFHVQVSLNPVELGGKVYIQGIVRDMTERKRAEEETHRVSRRMQLLLESAGEGIYGIDKEGRCTFINHAGAELLGYQPEEILGRSMHDVLHHHREDGSVYPVEECLIFRAFQKGEQCHVDTEVFWRKDGSFFPVDYSSYPITERETITGAVVTFTDITEPRREEENLRRLATVVRDSNDAITIQDFEGRITAWNRGAELMYGYSEKEALLMNIERLTASGKVAEQKEFIRRLIAGEAITSFETQRVTKDGRILDVWMTVTKLMDGAGNPVGLASTERDITQRQRLERLALRAQRLDAIGTLAGGVAHDLNNALAPILMGVEIIKASYPGEASLLDMVEVSAKRAAGMAKQLLTFAKGAEGERVLIHPSHLIKELENLMKGTFPKNIQLMVRFDPKLPPVLGDATQLHQVLLNLCVNARDAMPHGGTLTLEAKVQEVDAAYASSVPGAKPGKYLALCVRDTGTGIPPEIIDRIFDPFFTTKGLDKGTGLGLSTVLGIVKGSGGFLQVYSKPGQGSSFTAYLPADLPDSDAETKIKAVIEFRGHGETILFVDDEPQIREMARTVLRHLNLMPLTATDGADGLIKAALHRTELGAIITDLHMPFMDGLGFVGALRRMLPDIPIMVISGRMEDALNEEFKTLGVTSRLDKPFTEVELGRALEIILKKSI